MGGSLDELVGDDAHYDGIGAAEDTAARWATGRQDFIPNYDIRSAPDVP